MIQITIFQLHCEGRVRPRTENVVVVNICMLPNLIAGTWNQGGEITLKILDLKNMKPSEVQILDF